MDLRTAIEDYLTVHRIENHSHWTIYHTRERLYWFADWLEDDLLLWRNAPEVLPLA